MKFPRIQYRLFFVFFMGLLVYPTTSNAELIAQGFTNLTGTAERMISYRHQERFFITDDGAQHLLLNLGDRESESKGALALMAKQADQADWEEAVDFSCSNNESTADMVLENNRLHIVYSCNKEIWYSRLSYDALTSTWWNLKKKRIFKSLTQTPSAPTIAISSDQKLHVVFTRTALNKVVQLVGYSSNNPLFRWTSSGTFGSENKRPGKAGRILNIGADIALIYTDVSFVSGTARSTLNFIQLAEDGSWSDPVVLESTDAGFHDPYGSHYSAAVDDQGNIHLVWPVEKRLVYYRYDQGNSTWSADYILENPHNAVYSQVAKHIDGRIFLVFNVGEQLQVVESDDYGLTFSHTAFLIHPTGDPVYDWAQPRVETPAVFSGVLDVLQQLSTVPTETTEAVERLYLFSLTP
jgi:hypothetical protein